MPASSPRRFRLPALLAATGLLVGCYTVLPEYPSAPPTPPTYAYATADSTGVPFRAPRGPFPFAPSAAPATLVLRSWANVRALPPAPPVAYGPPRPSDFAGVDFDAEMVLMVTLGRAGYDTRIRVESVLAEPDRLVAYASTWRPCYSRGIAGFPIHAVALRADPRPVAFADLEEVRPPCGELRSD